MARRAGAADVNITVPDPFTSGTAWRVDLVTHVTDGDTLRLIRSREIELDGRRYWLADAEPEGVAIRLAWVDTPERGVHPGWEQGRADLMDWLSGKGRRAGALHVICYASAGWDRLLGDLLDPDGNSASQWLMTEGNGGAGWPPYVEG
jgi:endonuclease YncB( thermonuclease family)